MQIRTVPASELQKSMRSAPFRELVKRRGHDIDISDWYVGVDSRLHVFIQHATPKGWVAKIEQVPPSDAVSVISNIVGHVAEGDIMALEGEMKIEVMRLVLNA